MKLLSRAVRESVTPTRKNGRLFDPALRRRIATIALTPSVVPRPEHLHGAPARLFAAPGPARLPTERFHHLLHLHDLLHRPVHSLDRRAAALRDPFPAAPVDD